MVRVVNMHRNDHKCTCVQFGTVEANISETRTPIV